MGGEPVLRCTKLHFAAWYMSRCVLTAEQRGHTDSTKLALALLQDNPVMVVCKAAEHTDHSNLVAGCFGNTPTWCAMRTPKMVCFEILNLVCIEIPDLLCAQAAVCIDKPDLVVCKPLSIEAILKWLSASRVAGRQILIFLFAS